MRARARLAIGAVALGFATGCAGTATHSVAAELGALPPAAARVCVIRPGGVAGLTTMQVRDNGRVVAATRGKTWSCWLAAPGEHQIRSIDDDTGPTLLFARPGRQYWLHQDVTTMLVAPGSEAETLHAHLDWVDEATATEMIDACDARVRVSVPGLEDRTDASSVTRAAPNL